MSLLRKLVFLTCIFSVLCIFKDVPGDYCRTRTYRDCCPGRDDSCAVPIIGTLCYCDHFCNRSYGMDCCPDYFPHCLGIRIQPPPGQIVKDKGCFNKEEFYKLGYSYKNNCNKCKCQSKGGKLEFECDDGVCLIRPELIRTINDADYGWKASNYSFLWGKTLNEGIRYRLGTFRPSRTTLEMTEIHQNYDHLPESFDSRRKWSNFIQPVRDQGDCGSSWAFSTTSLASDRLGIESQGRERISLSPQHLISCQHRGQRGCHGGHLDRAWWFLRKKGVVTESCYPYENWFTDDDSKCKAKNWKNGNGKVKCPSGKEDIVHYFTPPYRLRPNESDIMKEIYDKGPVQATFEVKEDFFLYKSGIYHHTSASNYLPSKYRRSGWHSVRILGWGVENHRGKKIKYWLCANSWGERWGENGYFRILRGENECEIENFVVGVWAKRHVLNGNSNSRRHRRA